jgi:predicted metal-dependent phosphoesterase TrpH
VNGPRPTLRTAGAADLHVHTTHSDGTCSPGEVVRAAAAVGLAAVAITDHDTLSALAIARPEAQRLGIELIDGIELTAEYHGREIHVLGHFVNAKDPDLGATVLRLRAARAERIERLAARLGSLGLEVDLRALAQAFPRATLGRSHLADWLVRTGQVADRRQAFARYLGDRGPAQVPKPRLMGNEAIGLIRRAGGIAALAHPAYDFSLQALRELAEGGLGALEVAGPAIGKGHGRRWRLWADQLGLIPIAGSDFHAPDRPGRWVGAIVTPQSDFERLRAAACSSRVILRV